ncbi:MAG: cytochrome c peroxidase [Saprospiraceae bacterium]|jgi:cytochrome c peroxidase|tara:strand:+ start:2436 stop:3446 length:1011 start_codon:yes stop_codon:yes gene_type:complete
MKKWMVILFGLFLTVFGFFYTDIIEFEYPNHFPKPVYDFAKNKLTEKKVRLGRVLFYDPILSLDGSISCASCHSPYNAFAHTDHDLSHGIDDKIGIRNAPPLFNLAWQNSFMWDGAINHLDMQALAPITSPSEMGDSLLNVIMKLESSEKYRTLFNEAYGDSTITGQRLLLSLSQFQLTLVSGNSKYDKIKEGVDTFNIQEKLGYDLFVVNCSSCHTEPLFTSGNFASNGLKLDSTLMDFGRGRVTRLKSDNLLFKIPSLRNLEYTNPYMHDGRFEKLREVLNHYTDGVVNYGDAESSVRITKRFSLTSNEKSDILAFLRTLNDQDFVFTKKHRER